MIDNDKKSIRSAKPGKVYLVGAGPGDPSLITVKGQGLLRKAQVVIYDYLASEKLLEYVPKGAELIYAGKKGGSKHTHTQAEINRMLVEHALAGKIVVRLKGGDPFIFGRGGEEIEELVDAGVAFEVVPGVTSATAAATFAGVPITHRRFTSSVAFITGHEDPTKADTNIAWDKLATGIGTLVFYMGIKNLPSIAENLIKNGRDPRTPAMVVRWASTPEQLSVQGTLENIAEVAREANIRPPALVVIGEVVSLREKINWFEKRPLFGKRILITRTREQASDLVARLEDLGAECLEWPTISLAPPESYEELDRELARLVQYQWILFTSINAVNFFFKRLLETGRDARDLKGPRLGVVGTTTAEVLRSHGLRADLVPTEFTGEGLAADLIAQGVGGQKILLPRAAKAREILPEELTKAGAEVQVVPVYRNIRPEGKTEELRRLFINKRIDLVTFTSSSTVTNFLYMLNAADQRELQELLAGVSIAVIGPVTARTVEQAGLRVNIQPETFTIPELVESIREYLKADQKRFEP
jgi:uroporphyrinogen III methyltransferase / synthase